MSADTLSHPSYLTQAPQQERSRENMAQILNAAAEILETKTFEELTITEVVQKAGTSVGAFYGRFKDKDALLQALDERWFQEFELGLNEMIYQPGWAQQPIAAIVSQVVEFMAQTYGKDQGLLRSLTLKARLHADSRFRQREKRAWDELFPRLQEILLLHQGEIAHPNPELAIRFGFQQMFFALREMLLWEPLRQGFACEKTSLVDELRRSFLNYLEIRK